MMKLTIPGLGDFEWDIAGTNILIALGREEGARLGGVKVSGGLWYGTLDPKRCTPTTVLADTLEACVIRMIEVWKKLEASEDASKTAASIEKHGVEEWRDAYRDEGGFR